jgi:hypothetical protein
VSAVGQSALRVCESLNQSVILRVSLSVSQSTGTCLPPSAVCKMSPEVEETYTTEGTKEGERRDRVYRGVSACSDSMQIKRRSNATSSLLTLSCLYQRGLRLRGKRSGYQRLSEAGWH